MTVKRLRQHLINYLWHLPRAVFYSFKFGFPAKRLTLIGVTGTDGKTTTSTLIYQCLVNAGYQAALVSTVEAKIGADSIDTGFHTTSPDPKLVQKLLQKMIKRGTTHAVLEITSHALDQFRYWGCDFDVAVITNTTHEHLDYHDTMADYIHTKTRLFKHTRFAVLNADDQSYPLIKSQTPAKIVSYSIKNKSDFQAKNVKVSTVDLRFDLHHLPLITNSNYYYQTYNILAAAAVLNCLSLPLSLIQKTIVNFPNPKGRQEKVDNNLGLQAIIDFAHTPNALKETLSSLKSINSGRLIVIFGATGGRDQSKRPLMGQVVAKYANIALVTADDTRNEDVHRINDQIISGMPEATKPLLFTSSLITPNQILRLNQQATKSFLCLNCPNRQDAFNLAVKLAQPGDTVIACGKGHETTILHGTTEYPWSETKAFTTAFSQKEV